MFDILYVALRDVVSDCVVVRLWVFLYYYYVFKFKLNYSLTLLLIKLSVYQIISY